MKHQKVRTCSEKSRHRAKGQIGDKMSNKAQNKMNIHESILIGVNIQINMWGGGTLIPVNKHRKTKHCPL